MGGALCVFSAVTLLVECQEGHPACKTLRHLSPHVQVFSSGRGLREDRLTQDHLETGRSNTDGGGDDVVMYHKFDEFCLLIVVMMITHYVA